MKIEVGKRYWRRDGSISGVTSVKDGDLAYPFNAGHESYQADGVFSSRSGEHPLDLIKEYVEPVAEIPGLEGYRVVRYGKVKKGELYSDVNGIGERTVEEPSHGNYFIVEKLTPAKRTIVLKEILTRYGSKWGIDWFSDGDWPEDVLTPDEVIYTGNERTVEV